MRHRSIKVKITCFWEDAREIHKSMMRYTMGTGQYWKNIKFVNGDDYDKLIILTRPHPDEEYDPGKAITLLTEPPCSPNVQPHSNSVTIPVYLFLPFWGDLSADQSQAIRNMEKIKKNELLSSVTSELLWIDDLKGHALRLSFIQLLDSYIDEGFHLYGRKYTGKFFEMIKAYKGFIPNKYDGLWRYKYHFACENSFYPNYFTEKIADPIISECLCFYDGCQNIETFIDERAFVRINVKKPELSVEKIIKMINDNEWQKRIKYIRQEKKRLLYELNPLNIIWMVVNEMDVLNACKLNS